VDGNNGRCEIERNSNYVSGFYNVRNNVIVHISPQSSFVPYYLMKSEIDCEGRKVKPTDACIYETIEDWTNGITLDCISGNLLSGSYTFPS